MSMNVSHGESLIREVASWINGYITFPLLPGESAATRERFGASRMALVAAVWAIASHKFRSFDIFPRVVVTAAQSQAGKTTFAELLASVMLNGLPLLSNPTESALRLSLVENPDRCMAVDEAEKLQKETNPLREWLNVGHRQGAKVLRNDHGELVKFDVYCPMVLIMIGTPIPTLRSRSIEFELERKAPGKRYRQTAAEAEGTALRTQIETFWSEHSKPIGYPAVDITHLENRELANWEPLIRVVEHLGCSQALRNELIAASADMVAAKSGEGRKATNVKDAEEKATADRFGVAAVRDLLRVFKDGETSIPSIEAVSRLRELADGPWRSYRGSGLESPDVLAKLVSPFGLTTSPIWIGSRKTGRKQLNGYRLREVKVIAGKVDSPVE